MNGCTHIAKTRVLIEAFMAYLGPIENDLRDEAECGIIKLQDEVTALSDMLSEAKRMLKAPQQGEVMEDANETYRLTEGW